MITKLVPTVRRHYLFAFAGMLWTVAGGILCVRGTMWLRMLPPEVEFIVAVLCIAIAAAGYTFGFSKVVQKSIDRIRQMPERANIFAFTAVRGYVMIALMITIGITLRNSTTPRYYLILPYDVMGGVLLIGSVRFYRQFFVIARQKES
jgi:uncharacterized membrane protein